MVQILCSLLLTSLLIVLSYGCDIHCELLPKVPPRWIQSNQRVPITALKCTVEEGGSLDLNKIVQNYILQRDEENPPSLHSFDLYFNCSRALASFNFSATTSANPLITLALRLRDCNTTWSDISHVGELYSLLDVEIILTSLPSVVPETARSPLPGLSEIGFISVNFLNFTGYVQIENILPYNNVAMMSVGSLEVMCYHKGFYTSRRYCNESNVIYQPLLLPKLFPHLQTLSLAGVYSQDLETLLSFPWDENNLRLPLNLSESRLYRELANHNNRSKVYDYFSRSFAIRNNVQINISNFCHFHQSLNVINLQGNYLQNIPPDCFTPSPIELSTLQLLDLTRNSIGIFENGTFDKLEYLEVLHASDCKLRELQVGLFDDLVRLKVLDLDYNYIRILRAGLFSNLKLLTELYIHQNEISYMEQQTLPIYSLNLVRVDLRWNKLQDLPTDCFTLPNLYECDCGMNNISLDNFIETVAHFDPIKMDLVEPLAYYGQTYSRTLVGEMHQTAQTIVSLAGNNVTRFEFNNTWSREEKRQLATFFSFLQLNLDHPMECDCGLYYLREFIFTREAKAVVRASSYPHVLVLSANNFLTWRCQVNRILNPTYPILPFLHMPAENFICSSSNLMCHPDCKCYRGASTNDIVIDCTYKNLTAFPEDLPMPDGDGLLIVSLEHNQIVSYPPCNQPGYEWLQRVNKLNLQHNELTPESCPQTEAFMRCLKNVTHLYLAYNNIGYLPMSIRNYGYAQLSISGNKLICDCTTVWMKSWLQENSGVIENSIFMHCLHHVYPIVQMDKTDFVCHGILRYLSTIISLSFTVIAVIMVSITCYIYEFEIKVLLFEKLNWHPFDKQVEDEDKEHDVYLMYCREDEGWVINTLLAGLERSGYKTCVPDRDFTVGASTAEEMAQAFSNTHRVIVVISQNFVDNVNAMSDFFHAYNHDRSATQKRFLVLVKLRENVSFGDRNEIFKRYISTNYYVSVRSRTFWSRLQYWLPPLKRNTLPVSTENIEPDESSSSVDFPSDRLALLEG